MALPPELGLGQDAQATPGLSSPFSSRRGVLTAPPALPKWMLALLPWVLQRDIRGKAGCQPSLQALSPLPAPTSWAPARVLERSARRGNTLKQGGGCHKKLWRWAGSFLSEGL